MEVGINVNLHNKFEFEVRDAVTNELKQSAIAHNIILNNMYTYLINCYQFMQYIHVGTGNITEDDLDPTATSLHTSVVRRATTFDSNSFYLDNLFRRVKIQIEPAEYVGSHFSEVGLGSSTSTTSLLTHALITDSEGNPIVIEKTALDVLIIYATVYFTIGNLPSHVKLANIKWDKAVEQNHLLRYLVSGGTNSTISSGIALGTYGATDAAEIYLNLSGTQVGYKEVNLTTNLSERKIIFPVRRFEIAEGNGHIQEISFGNSFNIALPNSAYTGTQYNNIALSGQNGTKDIFMLPSANIDKDTIEVKINNTLSTVTLIQLPHYKLYEFIRTRTSPEYAMKTFTTDIEGITGFNQHYFGKIQKDGNAWKLDSSSIIDVQNYIPDHLLGLPILDSGTCVIHNKIFFKIRDYAGLRRTFLMSLDLTSMEVKIFYEYTSDVFQAGTHKISPDVFILYGSGASDSERPRFFYTPDQGDTWVNYSPFNKGNYYLSHTRGGACLFKWRHWTNWQTIQGPTATPANVTVIDKTDHSDFCSLYNDSIVVAFNGVGGIASYHQNSLTEWEKNDLITSPDDTNIYTSGWFVGDDSLVMYNSDVVSLWKKKDGIWEREILGLSMLYPLIPHSLERCSAELAPKGSIYRRSYTADSILSEGSYAIKFDTPPLATDEITVSYKVNGIHKTDQYVLDVGAYIQFGEG